MKLELSKDAWQWPGGVGVMVIEAPSEGRNHTGTLVITDSGPLYLIDVDADDRVLMAHSHTRELEFVRYGDLTPYPSSPIESPTK